ncbi:MAG: hypothetical protein IKZ30_04165 [Oscillospiraceae bacterium]|nr:hypothetical protein [Oscillospiraceae bacterium]
MRVTNSMMVSQFLGDANRSLNRVAKSYKQVESTKRINGIADDPLATIASLKARNRLSALANYQSALGTAESYLTQAETSAADINTLLQSAYEMMASANSGAKDTEEFEAIAQEMANMRDELLAIGNSTVGTSYIFGGETVTQTPFTVEGNGHLIYNGIDMNNLGLEEDYNKCMDNTSKLTSELQDLYIQMGDTSATDYYAKNTLCNSVVDKINELVINAETAYAAADEYSNDNGCLGGNDSNVLNEARLETLKTAIADLKAVAASLNSEMDKPLTPEDTTGMLPDELANCFDRAGCQDIMSGLEAVLGISATPVEKTPVEETATSGNNLKGAWLIDNTTATGIPADHFAGKNGVSIQYSDFQDIVYDNFNEGSTPPGPINGFNIRLGDNDVADGKLTFDTAYGGGARVGHVKATIDVADLRYDTPTELSFYDDSTGELCFKVNVTFGRIPSADANATDIDLADLQNVNNDVAWPNNAVSNVNVTIDYGETGALGSALVGARVDYTKSEVNLIDNEGNPVTTTIGELLATEKKAVADLKIGSATTMNISANGVELLGDGAMNYYYMMDKCCKILRGELDQSLMGDMIGELQDAMSENSTIRTRFGASLERIDMINARYTTSELTYTSQQSEAEDVDLAEAITEWKTAQSVYDAALAAGAQIIQTSLLDFVR